METGRIAISGNAAELLGNESVQDAYLGGRNDTPNSMKSASGRGVCRGLERVAVNARPRPPI